LDTSVLSALINLAEVLTATVCVYAMPSHGHGAILQGNLAVCVIIDLLDLNRFFGK
jgi:hypothetical protein